jgi:hypothetical protein
MAGSKQDWNEELKGFRGVAMYSRRSTPALLMMTLLAVTAGSAHSQPISTSRGGVVEVTVVPLTKEGKPPQEVRCVQEVTVVKGTASIQTFTGRRKELREGEKVCITPTGELTSDTALLVPVPPGGSVTPPCVTACNGNSGIQFR